MQGGHLLMQCTGGSKTPFNHWYPSGPQAPGPAHVTTYFSACQVMRAVYSLVVREWNMSWGPLGHGARNTAAYKGLGGLQRGCPKGPQLQKQQ
jgi:hypothetical protein